MGRRHVRGPPAPAKKEAAMAEIGRDGFDQLLDSVAAAGDRRASNARNVLAEIERQREELTGRGYHFTAPTGEQLVAKFASAKSPMIVFQGWSGSTGTPGTISYTVGINNPDPVAQGSLFVHLFIGPANVAPNVNNALGLVDQRFPRLTEPEFFGLTIQPGATDSLSFSVDVPAGVEPSNYLGNSFLFQATWHDPGQYLDRSLFVFKVV
jgi:hypothetical protein